MLMRSGGTVESRAPLAGKYGEENMAKDHIEAVASDVLEARVEYLEQRVKDERQERAAMEETLATAYNTEMRNLLDQVNKAESEVFLGRVRARESTGTEEDQTIAEGVSPSRQSISRDIGALAEARFAEPTPAVAALDTALSLSNADLARLMAVLGPVAEERATYRSSEAWQFATALRRVRGNDSCADCRGSSVSDLTWCAVVEGKDDQTFGALLCSDCAGAHRARRSVARQRAQEGLDFGAHVTETRSLKLDEWASHMMAPMFEAGNAALNDMYEVHPEAVVHKPAADADLDAKYAYIFAKYSSRAL